VASFALAAGAVGLPRMGWERLAWGTTLGYCLGAGCVIGLLCRRGRGLRPSRADWEPDGNWLVRIVAFAQPPLALLMVISGGLRGAGATRGPLAVNFLGLLLVRLPLAAIGAWYAMAADLTVRGLAMLIIFTRKDWSRVRV
jgi:Na+-driven multidrug efflux pump